MLADEVVPQWRCIPVPNPLAARSSALFATALADEFSFELRKRRQQVQRRAAMQIRGVQGLRYRDQCYPMVLEQFHELLQVTQMAGQAIQPMHDHHINATGRCIHQQCLQARPLQMTAGDPTVLVDPVARLPTVAKLRGDHSWQP